jgi:hypothetical protein
MTFAATSNVSNIDIAKFLKIYSTNGVYNNLSTASEMWKLWLKLKAAPAGGRELRYLLRSSYGPSAVQSLPAGSSGAYPTGQRSGLQEGTAQYKDFGMTVNVPRNLLNKTGPELLQYADPLTEELDAKSIVAARIMSAQTQGDGSGAIGKVSSATASTSADTVTIVLDATSAEAGRSNAAWFEQDDKVKFAAAAGTSHATINNTATPVSYWKVVSTDPDASNGASPTVVLAPYDSNDALINISSATLGATDPTAGDYIYRFGTTPNDISGAISEYNSISEVLCGLESLTANDGRVVNGITLTGMLGGTRHDAGGNVIDSSDFQKVLSKAKRRTGRGRYKYKQAFMFDTVYDALVESRETDRRFMSIDDNKRGVKMLGYQHSGDFVEFVPDEFVHPKRIWMLPESKEVLEFYGRDFEVVEPNKGQKFHLANASSGGGHQRQVQTYMEGMGVAICKHPAAVACITNFSAN